MSVDPISLLVDPETHEPLRPVDAPTGDAMLVSQKGRQFPVRNGIPRFVPDDSYVESFGFQWNRFEVRRKEEDEAVFEVKTGVKPVDLRGLLILDAGCGGGRYSRVAAEHGATVVGADLSSAVEKARELTGEFPNALILQADLNRLPLPENRFDMVFSIGVLHHSENAEASFQQIAKRVRPGGRLSVWLYRKNSWPQERINDAARWLAHKMPRGMLIGFCRIGAFVGGIPFVGPIVSKIINVSTHPDAMIRVCDTFDWYSPRFQSHHTPNEVRSWFERAGFIEIRELPPAKSGRMYRALFSLGLIPGSGVNVTGVRRALIEEVH